MTAPVVVWWTIDSLRRDIIDVYGGDVKTQALSRLASSGTVYDGQSASSWTLPSVTSILTGDPPKEHGVDSQDDRLQPGSATLPQHFRHNGWRTLGIVANPWFSRRKGLDVGFDRFYNITEDESLLRTVSPSALLDHALHYRSRTGGLTADTDRHPSEPLIPDLASEWLASADRPVFMMVHTQGAHSPYHHPPSWDHHRGASDPRRAAYLNLVEFVDAQLERFLDGIDGEAIVIVTSDHGEALGEDGNWGHKIENMDLLLDVPLVIDGASPPFSGSEPVTHLDVHRWLRDDVAPSKRRQGRSDELEERLKTLGYVDGAHSV